LVEADRGQIFGSPLFTSYKNRAEQNPAAKSIICIEDFATQRKPLINEINNE